MNALPTLLKWYEGSGADQKAWFLRSIDSSGKFFGEVIAPSQKCQQTVSGTLLPDDFCKLQNLVEKLRTSALTSDSSNVKPGWTGLLATGPASKPQIILRYYPAEERSSERAARFLDLIDLLRPYLSVDASAKS
jgi:hypothetical protein